jgi:hypothetical protein
MTMHRAAWSAINAAEDLGHRVWLAQTIAAWPNITVEQKMICLAASVADGLPTVAEVGRTLDLEPAIIFKALKTKGLPMELIDVDGHTSKGDPGAWSIVAVAGLGGGH